MAMGSSLYTIRLLIECLSLSPIPGTNDSDSLTTDGEADHEDPVGRSSKGKVAHLAATVLGVFGEDEIWVIESLLGQIEGDPVLGFVRASLARISLEVHPDNLPVLP
jgi:hypothetical protein